MLLTSELCSTKRILQKEEEEKGTEMEEKNIYTSK
jgi:hypothetical protein